MGKYQKGKSVTYSISNSREQEVKRAQGVLKQLRRYLGATLFCIIFSIVYETFSHGVYSIYMIGLGLIPLVLGVLPSYLALKLAGLRSSNQWQATVHALAVLSLTLGSALQGVLEIYGTTSTWTIYYLVLGMALLWLSLGIWLVSFIKKQLAGETLPDRRVTLGVKSSAKNSGLYKNFLI